MHVGTNNVSRGSCSCGLSGDTNNASLSPPEHCLCAAAPSPSVIQHQPTVLFVLPHVCVYVSSNLAAPLHQQARTLGPWSSAVELVNARQAAIDERNSKLQQQAEQRGECCWHFQHYRNCAVLD